ncbi:MAG: HEPN domain-containing protein [Candidatus Diapherotrites archaeon]
MGAVKDCFEKGLLKSTAKSRSLALQDLRQGDFFLGEATDLLEIAKNEMAAIALYNAAFHAARALLCIDGVKEKSHYCLQKYLEEKYCDAGALSSADLSLFDILRGMRQEVQYGVVKVKFGEDLPVLCEKTESFIGKIRKIIG